MNLQFMQVSKAIGSAAIRNFFKSACNLTVGPSGVLLLASCLFFAPTAWSQTTPADHTKADGNAPAAPREGSATGETKITPKQAEDLFHEVDEVLKFASDDTGLPIKGEVKRRLVDRDEVVAYLRKSLAEDKDAQRLRRSELVLKKFGLLPPDFDLQTFLVALLREQVAGYYDSKTKTVSLLDWLDVEQQLPVLAHELTHALQDQSFDLDKWMRAGPDLDGIKTPTSADIEGDEIGETRQALVEGQAMVVMIDQMLAPMGKSLLTSPEMVEALKAGMLVGAADSPAFQNAPIFIKEALTFPYRYGLDFVAELLRAGGKDRAFTRALMTPPEISRQIMEPKTYLSGEHIAPMPLPNFEEDFKSYDRFDVGAMGEFDVAILIDQYAGTEASHKLYPSWRGGYYYAARPKGDAAAPLALLYVSRWATAESAAEFAAIYAKALETRYKHVQRSADTGKGDVNLSATDIFRGAHTWLTEQGPVVIDQESDQMMITESVDQPTTDKLERELFKAAGRATAAAGSREKR